MKQIAVILLSYLFGSVPWGLIIGKVFYHKDIREEGSGNLGASNAGRVLGKHVAVIVTVLDALKAFFSMCIAGMIAPESVIFAGLACCIGHCFPVFAGFRGGKAVATTYGFFLGITVFLTHHWFYNFLLPILLFFLILYLTKMVSISSILSVFSEVFITLIQACLHVIPFSIPAAVFVLWAFVTYRHKSNLERIKNGTENKVKWMG